jgi:hypothetical protein
VIKGAKQYRVASGYGSSTKMLEQMLLNSDEEALEWFVRRWGSDGASGRVRTARVQKLGDDGHWRGVR